MTTGGKGGHPLTAILYDKTPRFFPQIDRLITDIARSGGKKELERAFNWHALPPLPEFEKSLKKMQKRLHAEAKQRGWEI